MGDRVRVQLPVPDIYVTSHPSLLSIPFHPSGAVNDDQFGLERKRQMNEGCAGTCKTVRSLENVCHT